MSISPVSGLQAAKKIVSGTAGQGNYTTIQAAITAASSGETILIKPGTYTENLTLKAGVNLTAFNCDAFTPNVTIIGKCTLTVAGTVSISGIRLQTNSDFALAITGSAASIINLSNCYLNFSNNTGISHTSSSSSSIINIYNCTGDTGTTGISLFTSTSAGNINLYNTNFTNSGASTTASTTSSGQITSRNCSFQLPFSSSGTGTFNFFYSNIECQNGNVTSFTTAGTGTNFAHKCFIISGTASALSIGAGTTFNIDACTIGSSNTNAITGAGTLKFNVINSLPTGNNIVNNVTTQTASYSNLSQYIATGQPAFFAWLANTSSNVTGDGTTASVPFDTEDFDIGGNFASNTFTAPVAGKYYFYASVLAQQVTAAMTSTIIMVISGKNYTNGNWGTSVTGNMPQVISAIVNMAAGDTAVVSIAMAGGAKVVAIYGAAGDRRTYFTGYLLG